MTSTATPPPALASLAAAVATSPTAAASGSPAHATVAREHGPPAAGQDGAFPALLLALRPAGGTTAGMPDASLPADVSADMQAAETPRAGPAPLLSLPFPPANAAPPAGENGTDGGEALPSDGTDLPLPDVEDLLATLSWPGTLVSGPAEATSPMMDASATSLPEPLASPAAIAGMAPAGVDAANAASPIADNEPAAQAAPATIPGAAADPRAQITRLSDAGEIHASGDPAMAGTDTAPELLTEGTTLPDPELTLPTDFRARLEAIMVPAQRTAVASDNLTGVWSPLTSVSPGSTGAPSGVPTGPAATLFESLTVLEPLDDRNAWSQGLGERLLLMAERGAQAATLRLQPEHLGPMEIRIRVDEDGATQVLFSAHHAQTRDALENAIPRLRELLADQGLNLMQANVDSGRSSAFAQRDFAAGLPAWRSWSTDDTEVAALPDAALWQIRRDPGRRVDVFV